MCLRFMVYMIYGEDRMAVGKQIFVLCRGRSSSSCSSGSGSDKDSSVTSVIVKCQVIKL